MTSNVETTAAPLVPRPILDGPVGIRGFLLLFTVGQIVALLINGAQLPSLLEGFAPDVWALGNSIPAYRPMVVIEALGQVAIIGCGAIGLWLLLRKDVRTPRFYRIFLAFVVGYGLIELGGSHLVYSDFIELATQAGQPTQDLEGLRREASTTALRMIAGCLVWGLYWRKSKRVANTFVEVPAVDSASRGA